MNQLLNDNFNSFIPIIFPIDTLLNFCDTFRISKSLQKVVLGHMAILLNGFCFLSETFRDMP